MDNSVFVPLSMQKRSQLNTKEAARYLGKRKSTLYKWSHSGNGPIKPEKDGFRLEWKTVDIKNFLGAL